MSGKGGDQSPGNLIIVQRTRRNRQKHVGRRSEKQGTSRKETARREQRVQGQVGWTNGAKCNEQAERPSVTTTGNEKEKGSKAQ